MLMPVECTCGKTFRVKAERIGQSGKCPACGSTIVVTAPDVEESPELGLDFYGFAENGRAEFPPDLIDVSDPIVGPKAVAPPLPTRVEIPVEADRAPGPDLPPMEILFPKKARWSPMAYANPDSVHLPPQRVVLVGLKVPFGDLFVLAARLWAATLLLGLLLFVVFGIIYMMFASALR